MGLDMYIDKCRKPTMKEFNGGLYRDYEERVQMCYWRKNWDLFYKFPYRDEEYGKDLQLTKEDLEMVLDHVTHNRDYFGGFKTVESVCELLDQWDELHDDGWIVCYNANW